MHALPPSPHTPGRLSFRCPSCLQVLLVDPRLAGTAAPCPLCAAPIVAPQPVVNGIPFATLLGAQPSPFTPSDPSASVSQTKTTSSPNKVVLADGCISQSHSDKKDSAATLKMLIFVILTLGACLITALFLTRG